MKKNPFLTVMIIPHTEDGPKSLKVSVYLLRLLAIALIIALMFSFLWIYDYTYVKRENETLQIAKSENEEIIKKYSQDYLSLYQDINVLNEKMSGMQELESQIRLKNDFDPTKSVFTTNNQIALSGDKGSKIVAYGNDIDSAKDSVEVLKNALPEKEKSLNELIRLMEDRAEVLLSIPSISPTYGRITSRFGYRRDPINGSLDFHDGYDIANSYGTPIYATADGIVTFSGRNGGYGNQVIINHGNGFETIYAHNSKNLVKKGEFVQKGQVVSYMGSTGRSTGPHVHYEVRKYGKKVNPATYMY